MSCRCFIGTVTSSGRVRGIYCHNGGVLTSVGVCLLRNYNNVAKIRELLSLGEISVLGERVNPISNNHNFEHREEGTTVAYHRDRKEKYTAPYVFKDVEMYISQYALEFELTCLFYVNEKRWHFFNSNMKEILVLDCERNKLLKESK